MNLAPVSLFVYNRLDHTHQTVEALQINTLSAETNLFIFSDAPKNEEHAVAVYKVRNYIKTIDGFKSVTIIERKSNFGLARSIIEGVTSIVNEYGRVIVLEDDLVTSPYFLQYMNDGLNVYDKNDDVASIHGYVYPIDNLPETFFIRGADCWGWATWKEKWALFEPDGALLLAELKHRNLTKRFDFNGAYAFTQMLRDQIDGKNNSWAVRWHASAFLNNKYTLYPSKPLVLNIGNDGSGTHSGDTNSYFSELATLPVKIMPIPVLESEESFMAFKLFFNKFNGFFARVKMAFVKVVGKF